MAKKKASKNTVPARPERPLHHIAGLIALLAAAVRGIVTFDYSRSIFWSSVWMDSATYNDWAKSMVLSGDWLGTQPFFMTPFYPYFLAVVYSIFGIELAAVRIVQILLSAATAGLVVLIAARFFTRRGAVIAGLIAALYGPLVFFVNLLLVETVKVFFVTLSLFLTLRASDSGRRSDMIWCGLSVGAAILCRPTDALLLLPILLLPAVKGSVPRAEAFRSAAAVLAGVMLLVAPVTLRNYALSGEFIPVTSNGGLNFYLGNNTQAPGVFYNPEQFNMVHDPSGSGHLERQFSRPFSHGETSSYWTGKALAYITDHPGDFLTLMARKTMLFFHHREIGQLGYGYDFMAEYISTLLPLLPVFITVMPFALLGMAVHRRDWRRHFLLHGFLWMSVLGVVLFFITDRYRLSAMPMFFVFAGAGADWLWRKVQERATRSLLKGGGVIAAAVLGGTLLNFPVGKDYSVEYYNIGLTYFESKRYQEAAAAYRTSLSLRESQTVYNSLGNVYAATGDLAQAEQMYRRSFAMNPNEAAPVFSIGTLFVRQQRWDSALVYFDRALAINPRFAPARLNKGLTYYYLQQFERAIPELEAYVALETDRTRTASVRNDIENLRRLVRERTPPER